MMNVLRMLIPGGRASDTCILHAGYAYDDEDDEEDDGVDDDEDDDDVEVGDAAAADDDDDCQHHHARCNSFAALGADPCALLVCPL